MDPEKLKKEAAWVILMFDQANTAKAIENLPTGRGRLLKDAIEDLRSLYAQGEISQLTNDGTWTKRE